VGKGETMDTEVHRAFGADHLAEPWQLTMAVLHIKAAWWRERKRVQAVCIWEIDHPATVHSI